MVGQFPSFNTLLLLIFSLLSSHLTLFPSRCYWLDYLCLQNRRVVLLQQCWGSHLSILSLLPHLSILSLQAFKAHATYTDPISRAAASLCSTKEVCKFITELGISKVCTSTLTSSLVISGSYFCAWVGQICLFKYRFCRSTPLVFKLAPN